MDDFNASKKTPLGERDLLVSGLTALDLALSENQIGQMLDFVRLISKWNKAYNLTAIRNQADMINLHLLDSLAMVSYIKGKRIVDVGTGAGLPGIPLALCLPEVQFTLLDSNAKKTRFVQQAILELKLSNVSVLHQRAEDHQPEQLYDAVITRAFASLADIIKLTTHLLAPEGELLAMKGQNMAEELVALPEAIAAKVRVTPVNVPGLEAGRCLVQISAETLKEAQS
jgi:16S rRNA (guanine527-N7)-methyltransferase